MNTSISLYDGADVALDIEEFIFMEKEKNPLTGRTEISK